MRGALQSVHYDLPSTFVQSKQCAFGETNCAVGPPSRESSCY